MAIKLRQSTASQEIPLGYFVDSTDGNTEETALTIANTDIKLWKMGATTLASKNSGGATHISNGLYYAVLDATDTNTLGALVVFVHVSGALAVRVECEVLPAVVYDAWIAGTDNFDVSVTQWTGTNVAAPNTAGYPVVTVKSGTGTGEVSLSSGLVSPAAGSISSTTFAAGAITASVIATGAVDADALAADAVDEILDEVVEGTLTMRQILRLALSALAGKASGGGTTTIAFRDNADSKARITATVDSSGNRTAVTLDAT